MNTASRQARHPSLWVHYVFIQVKIVIVTYTQQEQLKEQNTRKEWELNHIYYQAISWWIFWQYTSVNISIRVLVQYQNCFRIPCPVVSWNRSPISCFLIQYDCTHSLSQCSLLGPLEYSSCSSTALNSQRPPLTSTHQTDVYVSSKVVVW